ncbi:hypothetical protein CDD80_452 [Ophiocordyceps camponoti-rufipedis]|uniref:Mononegavirus-type SAM-dependent 2'-O-MTase domain-containing protein n=1 Tax=Ophiocordyceps camponoti-rufipedis TaxID=2004952 RepID=A0A2C5YJS9_9HYPO|nr:hypothetical protein CDD80_452 [Ophiocordyceps camponoti-rufipedis]
MYVQSRLLTSALTLTLHILRPGGNLVAKIFRGRNADVLHAQLRTYFSRVVVAKPRSSRASSVEAFLVCLGFRGGQRDEQGGETGVAPFVACGDLAAFDADASYRLPGGHVSLEPVQRPIAPPYKRAVEMRASGEQRPRL